MEHFIQVCPSFLIASAALSDTPSHLCCCAAQGRGVYAAMALYKLLSLAGHKVGAGVLLSRRCLLDLVLPTPLCAHDFRHGEYLGFQGGVRVRQALPALPAAALRAAFCLLQAASCALPGDIDTSLHAILTSWMHSQAVPVLLPDQCHKLLHVCACNKLVDAESTCRKYVQQVMQESIDEHHDF